MRMDTLTELTKIACRDLPLASLDSNGKSTGTCMMQRGEPFLCHSMHANIDMQEQNRLSSTEMFCRGGRNSNERRTMVGNHDHDRECRGVKKKSARKMKIGRELIKAKCTNCERLVGDFFDNFVPRRATSPLGLFVQIKFILYYRK